MRHSKNYLGLILSTYVVLASALTAPAQWSTTDFSAGQGYTNTMGMDMFDALAERQWAASSDQDPPMYLGNNRWGYTGEELEYPFLVFDDQYFAMTQVVAGVTNTIPVYTNTVSSTRTNRDCFLPWVEYGHTNVPSFTSWSWTYDTPPKPASILRYLDVAIWELCGSDRYISPKHYTDITYQPFGLPPLGVPVSAGSFTNFNLWFGTPHETATETNYPTDFPRASVAELFEISGVGFMSQITTNTFTTATGGNTHFTTISTNAVRNTTVFYSVAGPFGWPLQASNWTRYEGWTYGPFPVLVFSPAVTTNAITISGTVSARAYDTNTSASVWAQQNQYEVAESFSISYVADTTNAYFALTNLFMRFDDDDTDGITVTTATITNVGDVLRVVYTNGASYMGHPDRAVGWYQNISATPTDLLFAERYSIWNLLYLTQPDNDPRRDLVATYATIERGVRRWSGYGWTEASANLELVIDEFAMWPQARMDYVDFDPDITEDSSVTENGAGSVYYALTDATSFYVTNFSRASWTYKLTYDSQGSVELTNTYAAATANYDLDIVSGGITSHIGNGTLAANAAITIGWTITGSSNIVTDGDNSISWYTEDGGGTEDAKLLAQNKTAFITSDTYVGAWLDSRRAVERVYVDGINTNLASLRSWYTKMDDGFPYVATTVWPNMVGEITANDYGSLYTYTAPDAFGSESREFYVMATNDVEWLNPTNFFTMGIMDMPHQIFGLNTYTNQMGFLFAADSFRVHMDWQYSADGFVRIWGRE